MLCECRGPQTETIVMFSGKDHAPEACVLQYGYPLSCINGTGVKKRRRFITVAPLLVSKSVDRKMDECVHLHLVPCELLRSWKRSNWIWWRCSAGNQDNQQGANH